MFMHIFTTKYGWRVFSPHLYGDPGKKATRKQAERMGTSIFTYGTLGHQIGNLISARTQVRGQVLHWGICVL